MNFKNGAKFGEESKPWRQIRNFRNSGATFEKKKNVTKYLKTQQMNNGLNEDSNQPLLTPIGRRITNHMDDNKLTISNNKEKKSTFNSGAV